MNLNQKKKFFILSIYNILVALILSVINFYKNDVTSKIGSITIAPNFFDVKLSGKANQSMKRSIIQRI